MFCFFFWGLTSITSAAPSKHARLDRENRHMLYGNCNRPASDAAGRTGWSPWLYPVSKISRPELYNSSQSHTEPWVNPTMSMMEGGWAAGSRCIIILRRQLRWMTTCQSSVRLNILWSNFSQNQAELGFLASFRRFFVRLPVISPERT
jgi:hypothetical protein